MNIFIAEDRLQDYLYLRRLIEKWSKSREVEIKIYFRNRLYVSVKANGIKVLKRQ